MSGDHLKIALIDPSLFTVPYDAKLADALRALGHEVTVYGEARTPGEAPAELPGLRPLFYTELLRVAARRWPRQALRVAKGVLHWHAMRRLADELSRSKPDVIHFQWSPLPVIDRLFLRRLRRYAPVILTVHDSRPFNGAAWRLQKLGATSIMSAVDGVIVHTEEARERLVSYGAPPGRLARISHGLLHDVCPVAARPSRASDRVRFLLFGKLKPYKGADLLIEAFRLLPPDMRDRAEVQIVGKPYMDVEPLVRAAQGLESGVRLDLRFVPDDEMNELLAMADVIVFPYREIDVSGVLMAALRYGRPIIASRIGGFAELLADGRHAVLVPPGDARALSAGMARLCANPAERTAMGAAVAALGEAIPGWDDIARSTADFYRSILSGYQNQRSGTKTTSPGPIGIVSLAAQRRRSGSP
jgi:glycosyltransferase involved in cell wall biosynthesis